MRFLSGMFILYIPLENPTAEGFPKKSVKSGKFWYWHPRANEDSGFSASPDGSGFSCNEGFLSWDPGIGVRYVREAHAKK